MGQTKYGKYIIKEPMYKTRLQGLTMTMHVCGEEGCAGSVFPDFPADVALTCITEPLTMSPEPHAHDYDQLLCFLGNNPRNFFEFGAEIEINLGEEGEKHTIDTTSILFIPKGLIHCPLEFKKVNAPVIFMHICFAPAYKKVGESPEQPPHSERPRFSLEEILRLRGDKE